MHVFLTGSTGFFGKSFLDLIAAYNAHRNLNLKVTILARNPEKFKLDFPNLVNEVQIFFTKNNLRIFRAMHSLGDVALAISPNAYIAKIYC